MGPYYVVYIVLLFTDGPMRLVIYTATLFANGPFASAIYIIPLSTDQPMNTATVGLTSIYIEQHYLPIGRSHSTYTVHRYLRIGP